MAASRLRASSRVGFFQEAPKLPSKFEDDRVIQSILQRYLPKNHYEEIKGDLTRFGKFAVEELQEMGNNAESNPPKLEQFDVWGKRVDKLITSEGWRKMKDVAAREGLVAIGYERKFGEFSRLYQFAKLYLFVGTSSVYGCPLAMTDGAARLIELHGNEDLKATAYKRLTSRDPTQFWTSGQWMTERPGGSDVGNTETIAEENPDGTYNITGFKWFSSATDSEMAMLLARIVEKDGSAQNGSKGLSLFFAKIRDENGKLNGITVQKLKQKLGTKALPTAELELENTKGVLVGPKSRGVPVISTILNITRIHNALSSSGYMRTALQFTRDFAWKRKAFGKPIHEHPLHISTLASIELETRVATELTFYVVYLLGVTENSSPSTQASHLLRILTPIVKLYTAKQSIRVTSEAVECLGGLGYMEETILPRLLRDSQVGSIWEGTTNILSLDVIRVITSSPQHFDTLCQFVTKRIQDAQQFPELQESAKLLSSSLSIIQNFVSESFKSGWIEESARDLALSLGNVFSASLLIDAAVFSKDPVDIHCVNVWCQKGLIHNSHIFPAYKKISDVDYKLAMNKL